MWKNTVGCLGKPHDRSGIHHAIIDYNCSGTDLTVQGLNPALLDQVRVFAAAEGLFVWSPPQEEGE